MTLYHESTLRSVDFSIKSENEISQSSVIEICNPQTYIENNQKIKGILDPNLGTTSDKYNCFFCSQSYLHCEGHFGFCKLNDTMFHKPFIPFVISILECICIDTGMILLNNKQKKNILKLNEKVRINEIKQMVKQNKFVESPYSKKPLYKFYTDFRDKVNGMIYIFGENKVTKEISFFSAKQIKDIFINIQSKTLDFIGIKNVENFFYTNLPIPPISIRPSIKGDEWSQSYGESHLTQKLSDIVKWNIKLQEYQTLLEEISNSDQLSNHLLKKKNPINREDLIDRIKKAKTMLQYHIFSYYDNESNDIPKSILRSGSSQATRSLTYRYKQGKQGRIRANLNGKRVNFSARTVITSDSDIGTDEVGVPLSIATTITYPELVTKENIEKLNVYVKNGKNNYPGCEVIEVIKHTNLIPATTMTPLKKET
jgi:DNA-directed RNA polymerase II subunit RPB1